MKFIAAPDTAAAAADLLQAYLQNSPAAAAFLAAAFAAFAAQWLVKALF